MKWSVLLVAMVTVCLVAASVAQAEDVYVRGYYRSNGTYVQPYHRTSPDGNPYNNYSYPGNYNPNTGQVTGSGNHGYGNSSGYGNGGDQLGGPRETLGNPYGSHGRGLLGD